MEPLIKGAWLVLAAVHAPPAAVLFVPSLTGRLYSVTPVDDAGVLIIHRGALFLAIVAATVFAAFDPALRRSASVIVTISVLGFLLIYIRAGLPAGALRTIAAADAVALVPLIFVIFQAWRFQINPVA